MFVEFIYDSIDSEKFISEDGSLAPIGLLIKSWFGGVKARINLGELVPGIRELMDKVRDDRKSMKANKRPEGLDVKEIH